MRCLYRKYVRVILLACLVIVLGYARWSRDQKEGITARQYATKRTLTISSKYSSVSANDTTDAVVQGIASVWQGLQDALSELKYTGNYTGPNINSNTAYVQKGTTSMSHELQKTLLELIKRFPEQKDVNNNVFQFNVSLSNSLDAFRTVPDLRHSECLQVTYDLDTLPTASIIIPFHNEVWSVVLRTINSVIYRSPAVLLKEIILVDDASTHDFLHQPLDDYVAALPKTFIIRNPSRQGLIRTRMNGARVASGDALIFLDAHVEVTSGWLEPLLEALRQRPGIIAHPAVDTIDADTLVYTPSTLSVGDFSWNFDYVWRPIPPRVQRVLNDHRDPIPTPTIVACAFAVKRDVFFNLGAFDEGMGIWGGENLEISFRFWMCSQGAFITPCSHVGHLFRKLFPYTVDFSHRVIQKNYQRAVDVWLDDYGQFYYASYRQRYQYSPEEARTLEDRRLLRKKLQCQSFDWYLKNVTPESFVPWSNASYQGQMKNLASLLCMQVSDKTGYADVVHCDHNQNQYFYIVSDRYLYYNSSHCMVFTDKDLMLRAVPCQHNSDHEWTVNTRVPFGIVKKSRGLLYRVNMCHQNMLAGVQCLTQLSMRHNRKAAGALELNVDLDYSYWSFTYKMDFSDIR